MRRFTRAARATVVLAAAGTIFGGAPARAQQPQTPPAAVAGKWAAALDIPDLGVANVTIVLVQDAERITGTYTGRYGEFPLAGTVKARAIDFLVTLDTDGGRSTMHFVGEVAEDGRTMKGGLTIEGMGEATWTARKQLPAADLL